MSGKIRVWSTKRALETGIECGMGLPMDSGGCWMDYKVCNEYLKPNEWHDLEEKAIAAAEKMRENEIKRLCSIDFKGSINYVR